MFDVLRLRDANIDKQIGNSIIVKALVNKVETKPTKNGSEYINISIADGAVHTNCKMWGPKEVDKSELVAGFVYEMTISVDRWDGKASCILKGYRKLEEKVLDYMETVDDAEKYCNIIQSAIELMDKNGVYYSIIVTLVNMDVIKKMMYHPAAKSHHHNIIGGLIMHTGTMLQAGYALAQIYKLDISLVIAGIILHDIEKLNELSCNMETGEIKYTTDGTLFGHIVMSVIEIDKAANLLGVADTEEVKLLKHCVLAHHGKLEFGSPVEPVIREALLIQYIDGLDSEMYKMNHMLNNMEPGSVVYEFGRAVYKCEEHIHLPDDLETEDE